MAFTPRTLAQATLVLTVPGTVIWISPAHVHMHLLVLLRAGMPPIVTVGDPGVQGSVIAGTQGAGVSTPSAAAVSEITSGLVGALHMPNGGMLSIGTMSKMLAAILVSAFVLFTGNTIRVDVDAPKLQLSVALIATSWAIGNHSPSLYGRDD
jgi:hypothetical protein